MKLVNDPTLSIDNFRSALKTHIRGATGHSALEAMRNAVYKSTTTTTTTITTWYPGSANAPLSVSDINDDSATVPR